MAEELDLEEQNCNRRDSIFSDAIDAATDWNRLISRMELNEGTIEDFKKLMYKCQSKRKEFVSVLLKHCSQQQNDDHPNRQLINVYDECLNFLNKACAILDIDPQHNKEIISTNNERLSIHIKDELFGMKKDIDFLKKLRTFFAECQSPGQNIPFTKYLNQMEFLSVLPSFHSFDFLREHENCVRFLETLKSGKDTANELKPILITDWDGTMKDYCFQYATNLQPIYSAISLAKFSQTYTRLSAVLTAGPLRGPGILDLIALPKDGPIVFGGSWGREWWFSGKRIVHNEGISDKGKTVLKYFKDEMDDLLKNNEFAQFALIGSGVQRKVDRLTLAVQTHSNGINSELSVRYQNEVKKRLNKVDPDSQFLHFEHSNSEVEIVLHKEGEVWDKARGMDQIITTLGESLENGKVLICGDTPSDVPMVNFGKLKNPTGVMALFVTCDDSLKKRVLDIVEDEDRCCFVSTPDVIHASMVTVLLKAQQMDGVDSEMEQRN